MSEPQLDFERFYPHEELRRHLQALADWKPRLARLRVIGNSPEGREILLVEVTNTRTGPADEKPGYLLHGNLHACELSGSTCALAFVHHLLANAESDAEIAGLLDRIAFHVVPRACPDGAEEVLVREHRVRSRESVTPRANCITPQDLNGDGKIHLMRVPDANGPWFAPDDEPRLMVARLPGDRGGRRYRLTTEGLVHAWDGGPWEDPCAVGFDFNRNWAANWRPRHEQWGAGRYPFSEPEVRALADYILDHPNLFGLFGLHNGTRAILRPPASGADGDYPRADIALFRQLAALGAELTGYPAKAIVDYRNQIEQPIRLHGAFTEWGYWHCGLFAMEIELGNLYNGAGWPTDRIFALTPAEERRMHRECLAWHDAHPEANAFAPWKPFDHPQLGPVEIGGWRPAGFYNVVPSERLDTWERTRRFLLALSERGPRLEIVGAQAERLADGLYHVVCRVANDGSLPTHVTALGATLSHVERVAVEVEAPEGAAFVSGRSRTEIGHLQAAEARQLDWVLRARRGTEILLAAHAPRCGRARTRITLDA